VGAVVKYEVGQKVWFQPRDRTGGVGREMTIETVGRKWAKVGPYRVGLDQTWIDGAGYTSPGRLYDSQQAHEQEMVKTRAWMNLRRNLEKHWHAPEHVTLEAIQRVTAELGFTLEDK
jgi:hypothetical protein